LSTGFRPTTVDVRKLERLPFRVVTNYQQCIVWFCHKAYVRSLDGQNYDSQDRTSIAVMNYNVPQTNVHNVHSVFSMELRFVVYQKQSNPVVCAVLRILSRDAT